jgi:hypothetical protein
MPITYVKLYKDGAWQKVESDRVERFLELGWTKDQEAKSLTKDKISVSAEVTSSKSEDEVEDWDPLSGESWADSEESMFVDDELPNDEEN